MSDLATRQGLVSCCIVVSDIPVLKIISVLLSIKFELNHFTISLYTVSEIFSLLVYIKFLEIISVQFQFQYLHHFSDSFVIDNIRTQSSAY